MITRTGSMRGMLSFAALGLALLANSCKGRDTMAPVVFAIEEDEDTDVETNDAPLWTRPARASMKNGALVSWYHEREAPGFHLRLVFPTWTEEEPARARDVQVVARAFEAQLAKYIDRVDGRVRLHFRPGRFEVAISGPSDHLGSVVRRLARVLGEGRPERMLARAQGRALSRYYVPDHADLAAVDVSARLLSATPWAQVVAKSDLAEASPRELEDAWRTLTNPRYAVVVVHAGVGAEEGAALLGELAAKWSARGRISSSDPETAAARLLGSWQDMEIPNEGRLLADRTAPLFVVPTDVAAVDSPLTLVFGRLVPTPTASARGMARLAQRVVQEELDARLELSGPIGLFLVRVPLSRRDVLGSVTRAVDDLAAIVETEQPVERLEQAARLWLGARMVSASLEGEDWTDLWSQSLDLAGSDEGVHRALALESHQMLEVEPAALRAFMADWLHPRSGQAGWTWSVSGADDEALGKLAELGRLQREPWE